MPEIFWSLYQNCVRNNKATIFHYKIEPFQIFGDFSHVTLIFVLVDQMEVFGTILGHKLAKNIKNV